MVNLTINNIAVSVPAGSTILQACESIGIDIPTLCYLEDLRADGSCRICIVEVEGARGLMASCSTPVTEGMKVTTESEKVVKARKDVLGLILSIHNIDCFNCKKIGKCKLHEYCERYDVDMASYEGIKNKYEIDDSNPFYSYDATKCIICRKCVRVCAELQGVGAIGLCERGFATHISPAFEGDLENSPCVSCGNCVSNCPTGALMPKKTVSAMYTERVLTTCSYCGVGCQMYLVKKGNKIIGVEPARGPSNKGLLCVKGKFGYDFIGHPDRLKTPLIKKDGEFVPATWEEAIELIASKVKETKEKYGADAFAGLSSARCTNEDNYVFQKMMRAAIGTNNVDHCARLCHASTVAGLATTLGSGAMTNSIDETEYEDCIFVTGTNTTENHPVIGTKMKRAVKNGAKLIVAEPREIELAKMADIYLQIKPGTNIALYNGMANAVLEAGLEDKEYIASRTEGFEEWKAIIAEYTPEKAAEICGVKAEDIRAAAKMYAEAKTAGIFYAMGVTQFATGTAGVMATSNLSLLCGKMGKEFCGVNPLRGQNNVQGACDMGALPGDLPGYQKIAKPDVIEKFNKAWDTKLSTNSGLTVTEIMNKAGDQIKFLYIMGENPMLSDPDINHVEHALNEIDFVVVQDIFLTETAALADVVLPAASFAEKDGTFTSTERRVQKVRKAVNAPGVAKSDWEILSDVMAALGYKNKFTTSAEVMDEIASVTPSYGGMSYDRLDGDGLQWPCPTKDHPGTKFLHASAFPRAGGKAIFLGAKYEDPRETPDEEYPLVFTTGRILYHYHTRTMTGKSEGLNKKAGKSYVEINPTDAARLGIADGDMVKVASRRGEITTTAKVTDITGAGSVFMPFHFVDGAANYITNPAVDPIAKIPELKVCACKITKA